MNTQTNSNKGFTIIEVVLVLAIAALIFLMVFIALPALQRGQANSARKNDAATIAAAITTYRTNKNGKLPETQAALTPYIDDLAQLTIEADSIEGTAATGVDKVIAQGERKDLLDIAKIYLGSKCNDDGDGVEDGSSKQAAVVAVVETGANQYDTVCSDS